MCEIDELKRLVVSNKFNMIEVILTFVLTIVFNLVVAILVSMIVHFVFVKVSKEELTMSY